MTRIANATLEHGQEEVDITAEMTQEGARILADRFSQAADWWLCEIAEEVYRAMHACDPLSSIRKKVRRQVDAT